MPFVTGNKIAIINVYDGCITLTDAPTIFSDYTVNGVTYSSVNDLQSALLDVIYTRNSLTNAAITLTTIGNSGAATLTGITLNIPNYIGGTGTTNFLPKFTGASTLGNSIIVESGDTIGIGTSSPQTYSNYSLLEINNTTGGGLRLKNSAGTGIFEVITNSSETYIKNIPALPMWFGTNNTERMRITSDGNVGIGTTSPSVAAGLGLVLNGQAGQTRLAFKNNYTGDTSTDGVQFALIGGSSGFVFQNRGADGYFSFETNGNERMRITSGGNVGIGTTSPAQKLDVNGLINSTNGICVGGEGVSRFWTGTQAAYDAITTKVSTNVYLIT